MPDEINKSKPRKRHARPAPQKRQRNSWGPVKTDGPLSLTQLFDNVIYLSIIRDEHKDLKFVTLALRLLKDYPYEPLSTIRDVLNSRNGYRATLERYYPEQLREYEEKVRSEAEHDV